ncbi:MAG: alpha/beta hydrolase [Roseobacter sp.]
MDLSDAYAISDHTPDAATYPPRWAAAALAFREALGARAVLAQPYGTGARHKFDLFLPEQTPRGVMVFVHGGYWKAFDRQDWSHLARGGVEAGWAVAMPGYDLCPDVRISQITRQVADAVAAAAGMIEGDLVLSGHSAGGHLVSRMCAPGMLPDTVRARLARVVPISPLADLEPLLQTSMNETLMLDAVEAAAESPVRQPPPQGVDVTVWVGADERPALLDQARWLAQAWGAGHVVVPGTHHFDVIEALEDPRSALMRLITDQN